MIEEAYKVGEAQELAVWGEDEAGPYQTKPHAGQSWCPEGHPEHYPHEYVRMGTAKIMTLFHPQSGQVRVKGTLSTTNLILHAWMKDELETILTHRAINSKTYKQDCSHNAQEMNSQKYWFSNDFQNRQPVQATWE